MGKVKLYYQCCDKLPLWDFCADAWLGARYQDIPAVPFENIDDVPTTPYNIICGSVEESVKWLQRGGHEIPTEINVTPSTPRWASTTKEFFEQEPVFPRFVKPKGSIKGFTGTVVSSYKDFEYATLGYEGEVWVSPVVEFLSEWRCYIHNGKLLKVCHYSGDPNIFPSSHHIRFFLKYANEFVKYRSYVLDVGVKYGDEPLTAKTEFTILVEGNDAWAIGNYGLEPKEYFNFIKDRWLQITGVLK